MVKQKLARASFAVGTHGSLMLSTAFMALAAGTVGVGPASAQSVVVDPVENDVIAPDPIATPIWTIGGDLFVGDTASGKLTIQNGGLVSNQAGYIGTNAGSQGTVLVTGTDGSGNASAWTNSGELVIGYSGTGSMTISGGARVTSGASNLGIDTTGMGMALVTGENSSWETTGHLSIGSGGQGILRVEKGGAIVSTAEASIGTSSGGDAVITGRGTSWDNTGQLTIGSYGDGTLRIEDGARVRSDQGYIGAGPGTNGAVMVSGPGSSWVSSLYSITVGNFGTGSLTIQDGGLVRAAGGLSLGYSDPGASGTLTLLGTAGNLAVLEAPQIAANLGAANVTIDGGMLRATADNSTFFQGFAARDIALGANGAVVDTVGHDIGIAPRMVGAGRLIKQGAGVLTLTGANVYSGGTTVDAGTLQLGSGGISGSIVGDVVNNGALAFNRSDDVTFVGAITGTGAIGQVGAGSTTLSGDNSYAGPTAVSAGTLLVNGNQSLATGRTSVASGAALGGTGTIGGDVTIADGGALAAGSPSAMPGTLAIRGSLALSAGSVLNYDFGQSGVVGGPLNDLISVDGDLILDGTLNVSVPAGGGFGPGLYRVFSYGGALSNSGLALGAMPGGSDVFVQTSVANQVNLVNTAGLTLNFWDGPAGPKNDGLIQGAGGTWRLGSGTNDWTELTGSVNADYAQDAVAVFAGAPGTVTVDNIQGNVRAAGLQFAANGYVIDGGALTLAGPAAIIWVGDGSTAGAGFTATIASTLTGDTQVIKTDAGTLSLTGNNSYTGGTAINGGTLRIAADANLGDLAGNLSFDGGTLNTTSSMTSNRPLIFPGAGTLATDAGTIVTLAGALSGGGALTKAGTGALLLTGDNTGYTGAATIDGGTLGVMSVLGGAVTVNAGGRLQGTGQVAGIANAGVVAPGASIGTLTVAGHYAGSGGRLEIEAELGGDASPADRLVVTGGTSGRTTITVLNRGGLGGQTREGIRIVDVAGASSGTFALDGDYAFQGEQAVIAGAYGYRLYQGGTSTPGDGDWYLRSALLNPGAPQEPAGPLYQPGVPVYEAYGQTLLALNDLGTMRQRIGDRRWMTSAGGQPSGIWGRMEGQRSRPNAVASTSLSDVNVDTWKMELGADHVLSQRGDGAALVLGVLGGYGEARVKVGSVFGDGRITTKGYSLGATLTWFGPQGFYIDSRAQISWFDSTLKSATLGKLADGNDGRGEAYSLEVGKSWPLGEHFALTPQVQMTYSSARFDRFAAPYGATVSSQLADSLKSRWGLSLDRQDAHSHVYTVASLSYEWLDGTVAEVSGTAIARRTDRLWGELGLGANVRLGNGLALYAEASGRTAARDFGDSYGLKANAGLRMAF